MAVTSGRVESNVGGNYSKFYVNWQQVSQSTANNSTTINWQAGLYTGTSSSHDFWYSNAVKITNVTINGQTVSTGGTWSNIKTGGDNQLLSNSITIPHNSDGTKTFSISITGWLYGSGNKSGSGSFTLTNIPRKTSITSFSVSKRSETTFTFSWSTADTVDYVWYSTNNGSSWTGYDVTDGTSGNFVVSGLSANTNYKCKIKARRKDSQLESDPSTTVSQTTYAAPTQSLKSKTETSITMNWSVDSTANYIWYSKDNGANWTAVGTVNATSGSYTISGLSANTTYNIKTRVRRSLASTTYDTTNLPVTTYPYPSIVENGVSKTDLKIGQSQTVTLNNPLSRNVTVYMKQNNTSGTTLYSGTTTGTSLTFTPNANTLYNSIPNSKEGNAVYYVVYSNQTSATRSGKYSIDNSQGQQNPTFSVTNWSYTANLTNLTNNDQMVINNQSTVTFSIDTPATAKNGASIAKYLLEWGTVNKETTSTEDTVVRGNANLLKVTAIDSRGYQTATSLDLGTNFVNYISIQSTSFTTEREDGVNANTTLNLRGTMFYDKFGSEGVQNQFTAAKYYVSTDNVNWSTGYNINLSDFTYQNNQYELRDYQIHANGSSGGFTIGTRYYIKVELTDKVSNTTITNILVTDGKLAVDTYQDSNGEYHRGINGLADSNYALKVHGNAKVNNIDAADENISGNLKFTGGTGSVLPSHFYRNMHDANGNVYDHYYKGTPTTNTTAQLRVWDKTNNTFKTLRFGGDGVMQWNGNTFNAAAYRGIKTLTAKSHSNYGTNNNYVPDMSFIAYWNGAYSSENASNLTYAHQGTIQCKPTVLYNNTTGTAGTVTLSQTAANFTYIDIFYKQQDNFFSFVRIYSPNNKMATLHGVASWDADTYYSNKNVTISGTQITNKYNSTWYITPSTGATGAAKQNKITIVRVDGWK